MGKIGATCLDRHSYAPERCAGCADDEIEMWRKRASAATAMLREVRMYALGNDCTTQALMARIDAFLSGQPSQ